MIKFQVPNSNTSWDINYFLPFWSSPDYRLQTDRKLCIRAQRASCTGGLKNYLRILTWILWSETLCRCYILTHVSLKKRIAAQNSHLDLTKTLNGAIPWLYATIQLVSFSYLLKKNMAFYIDWRIQNVLFLPTTLSCGHSVHGGKPDDRLWFQHQPTQKGIFTHTTLIERLQKNKYIKKMYF